MISVYTSSGIRVQDRTHVIPILFIFSNNDEPEYVSQWDGNSKYAIFSVGTLSPGSYKALIVCSLHGIHITPFTIDTSGECS